MATFWVEQAGDYSRTVFITPEKWTEIESHGVIRAYLAFRFANKTKKALRVGMRTLEGENSKFTWSIPRDFFTNDLRGPCQTQIVVSYFVGDPLIAFPIQYDEVVSAMLMTYEELSRR